MGREYVETDEEERSVSECVHSPFLHRRCCSVSERRINEGERKGGGGRVFHQGGTGKERKEKEEKSSKSGGTLYRKVCFLQVKKSGPKDARESFQEGILVTSFVCVSA